MTIQDMHERIIDSGIGEQVFQYITKTWLKDKYNLSIKNFSFSVTKLKIDYYPELCIVAEVLGLFIEEGDSFAIAIEDLALTEEQETVIEEILIEQAQV